MMLGRDETLPGTITTKAVNPTEYDQAVIAITNELHKMYTWDLINPTLWRLIGFASGPVKTWLTRYIQISKKWGDSYTANDSEKWINYFKNSFGYDPEISTAYLIALEKLYDNGKVSVNVYQPYDYTPTGTSTIFTDPLEAGTSLLKFGIVASVIAATIYMSGNSLLKKYG